MEKEIIKNYPENIIKLDELLICSNSIIGGGDFLKIQDYIPLIIGAGIVPNLWINIKINNNVINLVSDNKTFNNQLKISQNLNNKSITVTVNNITIVSAKMHSEFGCTVDKIDFRPIGLNIFGNSNEINVAGNILSKNKVHGAKFLIGMD